MNKLVEFGILELGMSDASRFFNDAKSASAKRRYTYTVDGTCDDGTAASLVFVLRENIGSYDLKLCPENFNGTLSYVKKVTVNIDGIKIKGWIYNSSGSDIDPLGWFFSEKEVPEAGAFVIFVGQEYSGGDYQPEAYFPARRSNP